MHEHMNQSENQASSELHLRVQALERAVEQLEARNERVEADKAWEISLTRAAFIAIITYLLAALLLMIIGAGNAFLGALIPTLGYVLSVQSLPAAKRRWLARRK